MFRIAIAQLAVKTLKPLNKGQIAETNQKKKSAAGKCETFENCSNDSHL